MDHISTNNSNLKNKLVSVNDLQSKAVCHGRENLLIVAGPGTGKTHTLTFRIANISEQIAAHQKILSITFTNKAADEMRDRLKNTFSIDTQESDKIFVGTFHSFAFNLLKKYWRRLQNNGSGLNEMFEVADADLIQSLLKEIWPKTSQKQRNEHLETIQRWKSIEFEQPKPEVAIQYDSFLHSHHLMDYDDLMLNVYKCLSDDASILEELQKSLAYVFVDEYQDINPIQHKLLLKIISGDVRLTAIGDPNQAIYGFRGSAVDYFNSFLTDFPPSSKLSLNQNYRSTQNLLEACSQVISQSKFDVPNLTPTKIIEGKLIVHQSQTDRAEAEYVVHQIEKLVGGTSLFSQDSKRVDVDSTAEYSFGDIAILYRLNMQSRPLQEAFCRSGIPFEVSGDKPYYEEDCRPDSERIKLMTIHASKGLEFEVVFIVGCEETLLPLDLLNLKSSKDEERRLFYVGMTRAKHTLFLTSAKKRIIFGKTVCNQQSPFINDINEELKRIEASTKKISQKKYQKSLQMDLFK